MSGAPMGFPEGGVVWAAPPPNGTTRNLVNPQSLGPMTIGISTTFLVIAAIFMTLRLYVRLGIQKGFTLDDGCAVIAFGLQTAYTGIAIYLASVGAIGRHIWETPLQVLFGVAIKYSIVLADLQPYAMLFTKLSLLFLYLRLFERNKLVRIGIWIGVGVCAVVYTIFMFVFIFLAETNPAEVAFNHAFGIVNFVTDIYILILPAVAIGSLQMRTSKKIGLIAVFTTGLVGIAMGILGMVYRLEFNQQNQQGDTSYDAAPRFTVNMVEVDVGIITGCMPVCAALFRNGAFGEIWLNTLRSLGTRLLTTRRSTSTNQSKGSKGSKGSRVIPGSSQTPSGNPYNKADYVELIESRKGSRTDQSQFSEASRPSVRIGRENWE